MASNPPEEPARAPAYAWYVLTILFLVYVLNFVDRQIISILAEDIKRDLNLKDEDQIFFPTCICKLILEHRHVFRASL